MARPASFLVPLLLAVSCVPSALAEDWTQFRGPRRDNISRETGLLREWPAEGPEELWSVEVAEGYSGAAIVDGRVFVHDYSTATSEWLVRAFDLLTGEEVWTFRESRRIRPNHGITRSVPAVTGGVVVSLDPKDVLHGLDRSTGEELWRRDLVAEDGAQIPPWYNGQNPLLDGGRVLVGVGGDTLVLALDAATGAEAWRTPNPEGWTVSHASLMPATLGGVEQILYNTLSGVHGLAAEDGRLLWHHAVKFNVSVSPSPLALDGERVFVTAGYDAGSELFRVVPEGDGFATSTIEAMSPETWNSEIHTPILLEGHLYAVDKKKRGQLTCLDATDVSQVWSSTPASFDLGSFLAADGLLFVLDGKSGTLRLVEATAEAYRELAAARVLEGPEAWAPLALSDGILVLRDPHELIALRVGGG